MNARLLLVALLGAALGGAAVGVSPLRSAPAPDPKPQRWEYKIVLVSSRSVAPGGGDDATDKLTEQFNVLAKDGWEYVGPVVQRVTSSQQCVAFRRSKS
jgi:hypothetical protein